jgi:integrase
MDEQERKSQSEKNCTKTALKYSKSDERYWQNRITFWNKTDKLYSVRMQHQKRTEIFKLHTANKKEASKKARDIFLSLKANGWDDTLEKYKPKAIEVVSSPTIGDIIRVFLDHHKISSSSANGYVSCLRTVVAGVMKIDKDSSRFSASTGGTAKWHEQVDSVELSSITQSSVDKWMKEFVEDRTEGDRTKERSSQISANTFLTGCRSIFGKKVIGAMREHLELPDSIPFDGATKIKVGKKRYESKIKIENLIAKAYRELRGIDQDQQWLTFLLSVAVGLRREEIDLLIWDQIDFKKRKVDLTGTKYFKPKGTLGDVTIDPELAGAIAEYKKKSNSEFVIESDIAPRFNTKNRFYRTEAHQEKLLLWLRANGFKDAKKPLHDLRKEAGSRVYERYGLMEASKFLRHGDVSTTADYYVDNSKNPTTGFGSLLTGKDAE